MKNLLLMKQAQIKKTNYMAIASIVIGMVTACSNASTVNSRIEQTADQPPSAAPPAAATHTSPPAPSAPPAAATHTSLDIDGINRKLKISQNTIQSSLEARAYRIGVGDVIHVSVFQVPDLSQNYQVDSAGSILIPLIGATDVLGLSTEQIQRNLTTKLGKDLLKNPQINVSMIKYRSQQITVMGAVKNPNVYTIERGLNVYEMLNLAGGLSEGAGNTMHIKTSQIDPQNETVSLLTESVDINQMFNPSSIDALELQNTLRRTILGDGDTLLVEEAGTVYIDGEVNKPGKYDLVTNMTVTQLLAVAGGDTFSGTERKVRILRKNSTQKFDVIEANIPRIKANLDEDILLKEQDIITVGQNAFKAAFKGFFDYVVRLFILF